MTQKQKAEAYDKALKKAKDSLNDGTISSNTIAYLQDIFPELRESEDERMRREIIESMRHQIDRFSDAPNVQKKYEYWIAWLEKQGKPNPYWEPTEEQYDALDYAYNSCPDTERGNYYEGVLSTLIDDLHRLEKQQKASKVEEAMRDVEQKAKAFTEAHKGETSDEILAQMRGEQKPANKVEPKFKVGDWITNGKLLVGQVTSFDGEYYHYMCDGLEQPLHVSNAHKWHLWTTQDAKDGDVLVCVGDDIEYVHLDAFINKACEWLENHNNYQRVLDNGRGIRFDMTQCVIDFRKAMKGE